MKPSSDIVTEILGEIQPAAIVFDPGSMVNGYAFTGVPPSVMKTAFSAFNEKDLAKKIDGFERVLVALKDKPLDREYFAQFLLKAYGDHGRPDEISQMLLEMPIRNSRVGIDAISSAADGYIAAGVKLDEARVLLHRAFAIQLGFETNLRPAEYPPEAWKQALQLSRVRLLSKLGRLELRGGNIDRAVRVFEAVVTLDDMPFSRRQLAEALEKVAPDRAAERYGFALSLSDPEDPTLLTAIEKLAPAVDPSAVIARARSERPGRKNAAVLGARLGAPLPEFMVRTESGTTLDRASLASADVVVVQFFSWDCGFCKAELPTFQRLRQRYPDRTKVRFVILGQKEGSDRFRAFFRENPYDLELAHDAEESAKTAFGVTSTPTVLIVGPGDRVDFRHIGYSDDFEKTLTAQVEALLSTTR